MPTPADERRHAPGTEELWGESWYFDFAAADGSIGGYVRLGLYPNLGVAWYWAYVVGHEAGLLAVRHHEVALPKGDVLEVREDGLWSAIHCETPLDHWSVGLEAFAVALERPADAYGDERGDRVALGLDLEWEAVAAPYDYPGVTRYEQSCRVSGEIAIGDDRIAFDGPGQRDHSWGVRDWWRFGWVWTSGALDDGTRFHAVRVDLPGGAAYTPGYVVNVGSTTATPEPIAIDTFTVDTDLDHDDHDLPVRSVMRLGGIDMTCEPVPGGMAPVRLDAPDGRVGRFPRALCRFTTTDGTDRTGHGWTEWNQPPASS
jgi:hypothetical protein